MDITPEIETIARALYSLDPVKVSLVPHVSPGHIERIEYEGGVARAIIGFDSPDVDKKRWYDQARAAALLAKKIDGNAVISILIKRDAEGDFLVEVPQLPGLMTHGETVEEALIMACDAITEVVSSIVASGEKVNERYT